MRLVKGRLLFAVAMVALLLTVATGYMWVSPGGALTLSRASAATALYDEDTVVSIYDSASPAVVEVKVTLQGTGFRSRSLQEGQGSGFLVDSQGHILTNNHVVAGASSIQVVLKGGNTIDAKVVGTDSVDDLALLSADPSAVSGITPLQLGDSSAVKPGQMAIALGSPFGLDGSITVGVISGLNRSLDSSMTGMLQTDAAIYPGNSGGPLLDSQGMVVGINTAIEAGAGAGGIGFAVPSNVATEALPSLMAGEQVARPWLGISGAALTPSVASSLGLSVSQGVYVVTVVPNSPADKTGLKGGGTDASGRLALGGDIVSAVDGRSVGSVEDLVSYFNTRAVGDQVVLTIVREDRTIEVTVTLGVWPE